MSLKSSATKEQKFFQLISLPHPIGFQARRTFSLKKNSKKKNSEKNSDHNFVSFRFPDAKKL